MSAPRLQLDPSNPAWWIASLQGVGYFLNPELATNIAFWWINRRGPLLLEGVPGGGKTRLAEAIKEVFALEEAGSFYRISCYRGIGKAQTLYTWDSTIQRVEMEAFIAGHNGAAPDDAASILYTDKTIVRGQLLRALLDPNPNALLLIDEIDKVPQNEAFEALMLEFLGEHCVTISEQNKKVRSASGYPIHTVITSNAGVDNSSLTDQLSSPLLRRALIYINIPEPTREKRYLILRTNAPTLQPSLIVDCVLYAQLANEWHLDKRVSLSEEINWVQRLAFAGVTELTPEVILATHATLAKIPNDSANIEMSAQANIASVKRLRAGFDIESCERLYQESLS